MSSTSFVSERLTLQAVEPAVAYLIRPIAPLHGQHTATVVSNALIAYLVPWSALAASKMAGTSPDIFTDHIGQICVRLVTFGNPIVVWPIACGIEEPPRPFLSHSSVIMASSSSRKESAQQASRTRLLLRSLVLQSAIDLQNLAKSAKQTNTTQSSPGSSPKPRPQLSVVIPASNPIEEMSPAEIIRTAIPIDPPTRRFSNSSIPVPPLPSGFGMPSPLPDYYCSPATPSLIGHSPGSSSYTRTSLPTPTVIHSGASSARSGEFLGVSSPEHPVLSPVAFSPLYLGDFSEFEITISENSSSKVESQAFTTFDSRFSWLKERSSRWISS